MNKITMRFKNLNLFLKNNFSFEKNLIYYFSTFVFFLHQTYYQLSVGSNVDEDVHILGAKLAIEKIKYVIFNYPWSDYLNYSDIEFYGYIYDIQSYFFSNNSFIRKIVSQIYYFQTENHLTYFLRHLYLTLYLVFIIYLIRKILTFIEDKNFSNQFVIFLYLLPIFNGYALTNQKDTTYSLHLFLALILYFNFINLSGKLLPTAIAISYVILLRFNAIAFLIIFCALYLFFNIKKINYIYIKKNFLLIIAIIPIYLIGLIPGWPELYDYIKRLYFTQFKYSFIGTTLINGKNYNSLDYDLDYLLKSLIYRLPVLFLIILIFGIINFKKLNLFVKISSMFIVCVNLAFVTYKPNVYDYLRQYLFLVPFLALVVTSQINIVNKIWQNFGKNNSKNLLTVIFIFYLLISQMGLKEYKYTYFNEFVDANNISLSNENCSANNLICGTWSSDFYGLSARKLAENFNNQKTNLICTYKNIYSDFLSINSDIIFLTDVAEYNENKFNFTYSSEIILELINEKKIDHFNIIAIHRIVEGGLSCINQFTKSGLDCEIIDGVTRKLRMANVQMSYVISCKI